MTTRPARTTGPTAGERAGLRSRAPLVVATTGALLLGTLLAALLTGTVAIATLARAVFDALGVAAVGVTTLRLLLHDVRDRHAGPLRRRADRAGVVVGVGWAIASIVLLCVLVARADAVSPLAVSSARVLDYLGVVASGRALLLVVGCALLVAALGVAGDRVPPGSAAVPAVLGVIALPVTGHASGAPAHELAVIALGVHVAAASAWVGSLGMVAATVLGRREAALTVVPRYSRLAVGCVALVLASGVLGAALRLPNPGALLSSDYGVLVLLKTVGLAAAAAIGALLRRRLLPAVAARRRAGVALVTVELAVLAAVVGVAAVLAGSATPH